MKLFTAALSIFTIFATAPVYAAGDLSRADVTEVRLEMGSNDKGMYFKPNKFEFETGKAYKLVMVNVDEIKHEVALNELVERIFTRKIETKDENGNLVTEVKGLITEVEIGPGKTVEWFFVPVQTVKNAEITCEIPGHREAGMHAMATIK